MEDAFSEYIHSLGNNIPDYIFEALGSFACIGLVVFITWKPNKNGWKWFSVLLLIEYILLILCSTVIFRLYNPDQSHNFTPFWSYVEVYHGNYTIQLPEKVMNLLVFLPVGMLSGCAFRHITCWKVILIGFVISTSIELLQFTLKRGFAEFDDVFHNTIGCFVGFLLIYLIRMVGWQGDSQWHQT